MEELSDCIPDQHTTETEIEDKELTLVINKFLNGLPKDARKIFLQRYWGLSSIKNISVMYEISESKVKMSLMRTRSKFKQYLEKEGIVL